MVEDRDLERLATRLGCDARDRIDADRVAARVVARLREPDRADGSSWRRVTWIALAAVLAGLLVGGVVFSRLRDPVVTADRTEFMVPLALEELSTDDLVDVLDSLRFEAPLDHVGAPGLHDLDDDELRELLMILEG